MKRAIQTFLLFLMVPYVAGQAAPAAPVELRQVRVVHQSSAEVQIEISLTGNVTPEVRVAEHPNRLIVILPGTQSNAKQRRIAINATGVHAVRYALNQSSPPETHVVVDLDSPLPYVVSQRGNNLVVTVQTGAAAEVRRRVGPAPAASAPITSVFRRQPAASIDASGSTLDAAVPAPPPAPPPVSFPATADAASSRAAASTSSVPSARHPNVGSLAEGTVFPGMGNPGTGVVPSAAESKAQPSGSDQKGVALTTAQIASGTLPATTASVQIAGPKLAARADTAPVPAPVNSVAKADNVKAPVASGTDMLRSTPTVAESDATAPASDSPKFPVVATRPDLRKAFRVKYVAQDAAYLDGGRSGGLADGMKLIVREDPASGETVVTAADGVDENGIAQLEVISVAESSAVTSIVAPKRPVKAGDLAYLSASDQEALVQRDALSATRKYPTVISFTEDDTLDEEARLEVPKPPLPSVNRARGRIGVDYMGMMSHDGTGASNTNLGLVVRTDITRINGTYWNLSGYWRGRLNSRASSSQPTLQDLLNRTYHLSMTYDNPNSAWVAGFGRLYLPWASSLDTIDGGYVGRRLRPGTTAGIFAGSTPDPTSWSYNPDGRIGGAFVNFEGGDYDRFHYTSTSGVGLSALKWTLQRPFLFFENGLSYKRFLSIYQSMQADSPRGNLDQPAPGPGIGRSFTTLRIQPHARIEFNVNHTYFRDLPTFDPSLIGTGLLDKYLFQGFSAGTRIEVLKQIWVYTDLGRSSRSGDSSNSLNEMFGVTFGKLPWIGVRADARYSRFNSAFGDGSYRALSLSRNFGEGLRFELLAGDQKFASSLAGSDRNRFINSSVEMNLGANYFLQGGFTINRGQLQKYDQWYMSFGYRFDSRQKKAH